MDRRQRHSRGGWGPSKLLGQSPRDPLVGESIPALRLRGVLLKSPSSSGNQGNEAKSLEPQPAISSGIDHRTDDVDPSVMDRFRLLKGRIERLNLVDAEEPHGLPSSLVIENRGPSGGKVDSRVDFDSNSGVGPGNHPRVLGSWSGGHFVGFPYGSSDWEHVLKEELTW
ncbi:unnamed protein product [Spirodela intermedia]|uniref:Uncharacterized protein n=1 Tax=Spirodela intermedia TaxID=51605 RepID=A0A7I8IEF4_SPIIN|nr:unnamed protein product [Spirodela intermedia]CAA6656178.1 unnamed protein product [Spirodela intermedia]